MSKQSWWAALVVMCLTEACEPSLVVGELPLAAMEPATCAEGGSRGLNENGVYNEGPVTAPWQTSFESGFCDYEDGEGFCYANPGSAFTVVTSPVRSGDFAAAFEMRGGDQPGLRQTRCVREGVLPEAAYYGAWYYIPTGFSGARDWNLIHFQGGRVGDQLENQWDVSMDERADGELEAFVFNLISGEIYRQEAPVPIPRDRWFQLEFYLKRAADPTGEIALYQDGQQLIERREIMTDDSPFSQWYVGNFTAAFAPSSSTSTLYVDDVSIRLP
jgi:hypothetical protein